VKFTPSLEAMIKSKFSLVLLLILLASCSVRPTYKSYDEGYDRDGYRDYVDRSIRDSTHNIYHVEFYAGHSVNEHGTNSGAMYRAAQVTLEHGGDYFTLLQDTVTTAVDRLTGRAVTSGTFGDGGTASLNKSGGPADVTRPISLKSFTIGKGPAPTGSYNAKDVLAQFKDKLSFPSK
jgi:hypothetical protein